MRLLKYFILFGIVAAQPRDGKGPRKEEKEELVFVHSVSIESDPLRGHRGEIVLFQVWRHGLMTPEYDFVHPWLNGLRAPLPVSRSLGRETSSQGPRFRKV